MDIGTLVFAPAWMDGREIGSFGGLVVDIDPDLPEYAGVWFPSLGELDSSDEGRAVQAILLSKIEVDGHLRDRYPSSLRPLREQIAAHSHSRTADVLAVIDETIAARMAGAR